MYSKALCSILESLEWPFIALLYNSIFGKLGRIASGVVFCNI